MTEEIPRLVKTLSPMQGVRIGSYEMLVRRFSRDEEGPYAFVEIINDSSSDVLHMYPGSRVRFNGTTIEYRGYKKFTFEGPRCEVHPVDRRPR